MARSKGRGGAIAATAIVALLLVYAVVVTASFLAVPVSDTSATHFDVIIVLGTPSLPNGEPSAEQRSRVDEGVREYRAGVAPRIIMTGGAAHNRFVEAHTMVELAVSEGVPRETLVEEGSAQNTIQNVFYSKQLMDAHGWQSAEVVSSPSHLPRTGLILEHYRFPWRTHAAPWPASFTRMHVAVVSWAEATYCLKLRLLGFAPSRFLPGN